MSTQTFEWIPHGDSSARKRARAHVTRGFRRQKAAQAQLLAVSSGSESSNTPKRGFSVSSHDSKAIVKSVPTGQPCEGDDVNEFSKTLEKAIDLHKTVGPDPFSAFPVKLNPEKQELLDHCKRPTRPISPILNTNLLRK